MTKPNAKKAQSEKIGPWRRQDCESFLALDCELKPPPPPPRETMLTGLFGSAFSYPNYLAPPPPADQQPLIDEAWRVRNEHPVYQWLKKNENFKAAWKAFE